MSVISQSPFRLRANTRKVTKEFRGLRQPTPWWHYPNSPRTSSSPVWSKNPIRMKSKDDGSRGPCGPDGSVTPRYITKKSPRNVRHGVLETSLTMSRVFNKIEFFDYTGINVHYLTRPTLTLHCRCFCVVLCGIPIDRLLAVPQ